MDNQTQEINYSKEKDSHKIVVLTNPFAVVVP
jgi:hypothetical protein